MQITVRRDNDPFKKYWWVLLLAFGGVGAWLCSPLLEGQSKGAMVQERGLKGSEQSLDSLANPSGAPGGPTDLSMEGTYRKKKQDGPISSSLTLPLDAESSHEKAPAAREESGSLASALKEVSKKKDPTGWGGAKVQKAFHAPRASFGGLSGLGSGSGGGTGASQSGFGSSVAKTGFATTKGLSGDAGFSAAGDGRTMRALKSAQSQPAGGAPTLGGVDLAAAQGARTFDGSRGAGGIGAAGQAEGGGLLSNLDSIPMNLKANDPNLQKFEVEPPPSKVADDSNDQEQKQKMILMAMTMVAGGMIGGTTGTMVMMMGPMLAQMGMSGGKNKDGGSGVAEQ